MDGGGLDILLESGDAECARRRQPHLRGPRHRHRRQHRRHARELHLDDRPDGAQHHDRLQPRPTRPPTRRPASLQLVRGRLDVRVPDRRRQLEPCTSPHTISPALTGGSHTFEVRAHRPGRQHRRNARRATPGRSTSPRRTRPSTPTRPTRPTTPPPTSLSAPAKAARPSSAVSTPAAGPPAPARTPISPALSGGSHTFEVRATDQAGNTDATPASHTWTVDVTAPNTTIDSDPGRPVQRHHADASPSAPRTRAARRFECRVDGGSWSSCSSPETSQHRSAQAATPSRCAATDTAGNTDATPASYTWTIDLTAPEHDHRLQPGRPVQQHHAELHLQLQREAARPSSAASTAAAGRPAQPAHDLTRADRGQPHLRRARHRRSRQHRRHPGELHLDGRPDRARTRPSTPARPTPRTTPRPTSASAPPRAARPSSAASTAAAGPSCTSPHDDLPRAQRRAATPSRCAPPTQAGNTDATPASHTWTVDLTAPEHHDRLQPRRPVERHDSDLHLQLRERGRLDLRVPHRRRQLELLHEPRDAQHPRRRQPHLRSARNRHGRQHRRDARRATPGRST